MKTFVYMLAICFCAMQMAGCQYGQVQLPALNPVAAVKQYHANHAVSLHKEVQVTILLGESLESFLGKIKQAYESLPPSLARSPSRIIINGKNVEVHFVRSSNNIYSLEDDQYTPYLFENGKLIATGWSSLSLLDGK